MPNSERDTVIKDCLTTFVSENAALILSNNSWHEELLSTLGRTLCLGGHQMLGQFEHLEVLNTAVQAAYSLKPIDKPSGTYLNST